MSGVPQWLLELREKRRGGGSRQPSAAQSRGRSGPADMLLELPPANLPHDDDPAEELAYGPGIVKKLKSRYISLTLREAGQKARPSIRGLRKAASLEHLLDDDRDPPPRKYERREPSALPPPTRYNRAPVRAEAVKRARSVEALVRCDSRTDDDSEPPTPEERTPPPATPPPPSVPPPATPPATPPPTPAPKLSPATPPSTPAPKLSPATPPPTPAPKLSPAPAPKLSPAPAPKLRAATPPPATVPRLPPAPPAPPPSPPTRPGTLSPDRPRRPKRPPPLLREAERPPSDVVRTALKIFETRPVERTKPPTRTGQVAVNVKAFAAKQPPAGPRPPKPAVPPRSPLPVQDLRGPPPRGLPKLPAAAQRPPAAGTSARDRAGSASPPPRSEVPRPAPRSPSGAPPRTPEPEARNGDVRTSTPERETTPAPVDSEISRIALREDERTTSESSEDGSYAPNGPFEAADPGPESPPFDFGGANGAPKDPRSPSAERAFVSSSDDDADADFPCARNPLFDRLAATLAGAKAEALPPLAPLVIPEYAVLLRPAPSPPKLPAVAEAPAEVPAREPPAPEPAPAPAANGVALTSREIEKNSINRAKSLEPIAREPPRENGVESPFAGLPRVKRHVEQQPTTFVYNFTNTSSRVPSHVEDDGVILNTCKRNRTKNNNTSQISLSGISCGESNTDFSDDVDDGGDWALWAAGPPSPCDVVFENDNVLINGRSNIAKPKKPNTKPKKLKIQFDDSLTRTFEYPSEASLIEESSMVNNISPLAMGCSLSTYTPSKVVLQADTFQLGVTKSASPIMNGQKMDIEEVSTPTNGDIESHNWSHETHIGAGDLLF